MTYRVWKWWERFTARLFENFIGWACLRFEQSEHFHD